MMTTQEIVDQMTSKMRKETTNPHEKNRTMNDTFGKEHHFQKRKRHSILKKTFQGMYHHLKRIVEKKDLRNQLFLTTGPLRLSTS